MEFIKMIELLSNLINGKRVLLLGFGKEGQATYELLKEIGSFSKLDIADINPQEHIKDCTVYSGAGYLDVIDDYDIAFKSPGVILPKNYKEYSCRITSQAEVFLQAYNRQVIGITGTKGKSTVSSLIYHVLSTNNIPSLFAGNIGKPVFEIVKDIKSDTIIVLELSCHQLDICEYSPALAVFLNLYEDHLDHYVTFENYARTKKNIYLHQHPLDMLYCDESVKPKKGEHASRVTTITKDDLPFNSFEAIRVDSLHGSHNLGNCAFVYIIAKTFGITDKEFVAALRTYEPLSHRLEHIGCKNGVDYYDDSISTTNESTISAIEAISNASTILLGGMDRRIDYTSLIKYISKSELSNVICMYESGKRIYDALQGYENLKPTLIYCNDLYEATEKAQEVTKAGTACILSPAAASYGAFKNFEERGDVFKKIIFG